MNLFKFFLLALVSCFTAFQLVWAAPAIDLMINPAPGDSKGTDMANIYTLTAKEQGSHSALGQYIVAFYADNILLIVLRNQALPASITRNFSGLSNGEHEIRVDIMDFANDSQVLASTKSKIVVKPK